MNYVKNKVGEMPIATASIFADNKEEAKDILFVHMSWGGAWAFYKYMDFLSGEGYNCHALDLRGHGDSGGTVEGTTMYDYVEDVRNAAVGLDLKNPIIVGHSMGGLIALMYSAQYGSMATVLLDSSPSLEVQKTSEKKVYPKVYTPQDSGMPTNPIKAMMKLPDIYPWDLIKMKKMLGVESGVARSERKLGISVPKEKLNQSLFFIGAGNGTSLPFGIGIEKVMKQAEYYGGDVYDVKNATHPGLLIGKHWKESAVAILDWLKKNNL